MCVGGGGRAMHPVTGWVLGSWGWGRVGGNGRGLGVRNTGGARGPGGPRAGLWWDSGAVLTS